MQQPEHQLDNIIDLLNSKDESVITDAVAEAHPADIADAIESLNPVDRPKVFSSVPEEVKGEVLSELNEGVFRDLATDIDKQELVDSVKQLDVDDLADLVPDLPEEILGDVLFSIDGDTRSGLGEVLSYAEDSAGGLMNLDVTVVRDNISIEAVLRFLRLKKQLPDQTDCVYLLDQNNCLTGILPMDRLVTAPTNHKAIEHAVEHPISFNCQDDEELVSKAFADYNLISAPVVDDDDKLLGRITIDDVVDVIREQAEHDIMAAAGLEDEADIFAPVIKTSRNRTIWLGVNLITALLGSWVIGQFEGSIQELVALAVLMPIVASMGGNAGTQTLTVVIRGMSTGTITTGNLKNVLRKESLVGVLNGLIWAMVIAAIAAAWYNNIQLGLVIAAAMVANLVMAAIAGVVIPWFLEKINIDPALAGGVALTTVTDVVGYFSVLGLATLILL